MTVTILDSSGHTVDLNASLGPVSATRSKAAIILLRVSPGRLVTLLTSSAQRSASSPASSRSISATEDTILAHSLCVTRCPVPFQSRNSGPLLSG